LRRLGQSRPGQGSRAQRVAGGVGVAQRRVDEEHVALHQSAFFAQLDDSLEEELIDPSPETPASLGQHAVVGQGFVELVAQEPPPGQVQRSLLAKSTLAPNVEEVAKQPELEQDHWVDRRLSGVAVVLLGQTAYESEVDHSRESTHDVVGRNRGLQREAQVELRLDRFGPHHGRYLLL